MVSSSIIDKAFAQRPDLKKRTYEAIAQSPQHAPLFNDLATYTQTLLSPSLPTTTTATTTNGLSTAPAPPPPPTKKRKLDAANDTNANANAPSPTPFLPPPPPPTTTTTTTTKTKEWNPPTHTLPSTSFLLPQRKKLTLELSTHPNAGLRARNPTTGLVEFAVAWTDVRHVLCVPVPEKAVRLWAFCVFAGGAGAGADAGAGAEPVVWTVAEEVPRGVSVAEGVRGEGGYMGFVRGVLDEGLGGVGSLRGGKKRVVVEADEREFASAVVRGHRRGERALHVSAFRGSKDGFLFFLATGILFAFKKPILFFAFDAIHSVSYTSVLQRTFNLNVTISTDPTSSLTSETGREEGEDTLQEFEFSMLDQADFAGIDAYVRRHGLQDASMAEQRRAKREGVNGVKGEGGGGEGELERARLEVEAAQEAGAGEGELGGNGDGDEEDEGEEGEDYDPGSEGGSEGSGTSSEEGGEEGGAGLGGREGFMVDELGSEGEEEEDGEEL